MLTHSDDISDLTSNLANAMEEMGDAKKGSSNPFFNSKYADLNQFIDASKKVLLDNGIVLTQHPVTEFHAGDTQTPPTVLIGCETLLIDSQSGQWMRSKLLLPCVKLDPQNAGSAITYARRYTMQAILNMPARDDDGNAATNHSKQLFESYSNSIKEANTIDDLAKYLKAAFGEDDLDSSQKAVLKNEATKRKEELSKGTD